MNNEDEKMFKAAASEIRRLRSSNELMAARLGMFDNIMQVLNTQPVSRSQGMSEDIVWAIEKHISNSPPDKE